jgi:hypothetical protein
MVERNDLAVDDGIVALGAVVVGVLDHGFKDRTSSSGVGVPDDLGDVFGKWTVGVCLPTNAIPSRSYAARDP